MLNPLPNLDDRRWTDLVEEGRALIPLYAPDWTDHNVQNPGTTILELLAFVAELDIFQLNRVPDRHKRKFLSLVGIHPRCPVPARTVLQFALTEKSGKVAIPEGVSLTTGGEQGADIPFRLAEPITAIPGSIEAVLVREGNTAVDYSRKFAHGEPVPIFGSAETSKPQLYVGFTEALPSDAWTSLYFEFSGTRSSDNERKRALSEAAAQAAACAPRVNPCLSDPSEAAPLTLPPHQSVKVVWEYRDASGAWTAADTQDETRSLTLNGSVRVKPATEMAAGGESGAPDALFYLRVRLDSGTYDAAPVARRLVLNGAVAEETTAEPAYIDTNGTGESDQSISLRGTPIVVASLKVTSVEDGRHYDWTLRPDFDSSGRGDRHYMLDADAGLICFGDGEHGLPPYKGSVVQASYLTTLASEGNFGEGHMFRLNSAIPDQEKIARIVNATASGGGAPAESLTAAASRAVQKLRVPQRAVTASDYEVLALETPGTVLARVAVVPSCHPAFDCIDAPGIVTVIPMTHLPVRAPEPSSGTLHLVGRYLKRRRIIGTRVEIVTPRYLKISVTASVRALAGTSPVLLTQRVSAALDAFLSPLDGGPDGQGWPAGRDVYRSEIMNVIDGVNGVDHVVALVLQAGDCGPVCGNVCVPALWFVTPGTHQVRVV